MNVSRDGICEVPETLAFKKKKTTNKYAVWLREKFYSQSPTIATVLELNSYSCCWQACQVFDNFVRHFVQRTKRPLEEVTFCIGTYILRGR